MYYQRLSDEEILSGFREHSPNVSLKTVAHHNFQSTERWHRCVVRAVYKN